MAVGIKGAVVLCAVFMGGCSDVYQISFPISFGEVGSVRSVNFDVDKDGDYTLSLAFPHVFERGDLVAEDKLKNLVWRGDDVRSAGVWVSLQSGTHTLCEGEFILKGSDGVLSIDVGGKKVSANIRAMKTIRLEPGEYVLEYRNLELDKGLGDIDTYIVLFLDEPKV